jgi:hypothetical protein
VVTKSEDEMSTVDKNEFQKSLARLESMSKGQLFHTGSNSEPGAWAGSAPQDEDSMCDEIQENGTDYDGVKKALSQKVQACKALTPAEVKMIKGQAPYAEIGAKIAKGQSLTGAEKWALGKTGRQTFGKSEGMANTETKDGAAEENKEARNIPGNAVANKEDGKEIAEAASKALQGAAGQGASLAKGIEMSPILHEFVQAFGHGLDAQSQAIVKSFAHTLAPLFARIEGVEKSLAQKIAQDAEFQKSLAETVVGIGQHVAGGADVAAQQQHLPAGAPRAQLRSVQGAVQGQLAPVNKSFEGGPGGLDVGEGAMAKSQIVAVMTDMVKGGKLNPLEVIKFESNNQLSPQVQQAVLAHAQQGNRG